MEDGKMTSKFAVALLATLFCGAALAAPDKAECIAPAKPGGGFDLTCKLAQAGLQQGKYMEAPLRITYMPGGIGAVAYNTVIAQRPDEAGTIVAYSGGSLLNLAVGKFGRYTVNDVKWLAAIGADYGAVSVRADSPYKTMKDLIEALKVDPTKVVMGAGGSVGSQDWMKSALVAKTAGVNYRNMRYVAFEGGGEALTALLGGHVHAYFGDASEVGEYVKSNKVRVLAVFSAERLPGVLTNVPTAKEQGYNVEWPIIRGFYVGPKVADADYKWWLSTFDKMLASPEFAKQRETMGLFPFSMTGAKLDAYIKERVKQYGELATEFGLVAK
jgi:putative tricarboxylic transport membrane protein